jgi:hypothetical protein
LKKEVLNSPPVCQSVSLLSNLGYINVKSNETQHVLGEEGNDLTRARTHKGFGELQETAEKQFTVTQLSTNYLLLWNLNIHCHV